MTKREELLALADRVEALTGPDREVDALIRILLNPPELQEERRMQRIFSPDATEAQFEKHMRWRIEQYSPAYTASLDAAMTLVPEGFMWRLQSWPDGVNNVILEKDAGDFGAIDARHTETFAATPAFALTAAALRAQAQNQDNTSKGEGA